MSSRTRKTPRLDGRFGLLLARSCALFLGAFIVLGLLDWLRQPSFNPNI